MYDEMIEAVNRFLYAYGIEDTAMVLCNIMLDLVEMTDEDFADEIISVVMSNERFDLD